MSNAREKRWTETFERLPEGKRSRILSCAKKAFASSGYAGANINRIAEEAGVSVGSLYKYFRTKENLFLALIEKSHSLIETTIDSALSQKPGFFERVEILLRAAVESSRADPESVRLYIACTTEELSPLAGRLSNSIEAISAERYRAMVAEAKRRGEIRGDLDDGWTAFFLDDLLLLTQYSVGSAYYAERLRLYTAPGYAVSSNASSGPVPDDEIIVRLLVYIRRALS
jgi:TetR/AcrR family transcriptional regulator